MSWFGAGGEDGGVRSTRATADLDELYQAHAARLVAQLFALTQDLPLAEDLVQEAFARAVARWGRISTYDDPVGWVRRVAWNLAASALRRRGRAARSATEPGLVPGPSPDRVVLAAALAALPLPQRRVVVLFYLADLSLHDIAAFEGTSENAVKQRLHRARAALAAALGDPPPQNPPPQNSPPQNPPPQNPSPSPSPKSDPEPTPETEASRA